MNQSSERLLAMPPEFRCRHITNHPSLSNVEQNMFLTTRSHVQDNLSSRILLRCNSLKIFSLVGGRI
ncbi:hypothetical protein L6452_00497 [Arctium lappa]|uniref:Uncharacterized protein n=1 Tax=Arctium lappa TaxID=4217 RepID=A0ACB9FE14_ARCLA|nr:hypothetical protein L6452_00497 [Arctium lappa]